MVWQSALNLSQTSWDRVLVEKGAPRVEERRIDDNKVIRLYHTHRLTYKSRNKSIRY